MRAPKARIGVLAAVALSLLGAGSAHAADPIGPTPPNVSVDVGSAVGGRALPSGFVGVSLEFGAVHFYTGRDPAAVNPVLVQLIRNLAPGQRPVIRIGGDSTDFSWFPAPGVIPPDGVRYPITRNWLSTTRALARAAGARLILGINLAARRPALALAEARAFEHGIGGQYIQALELGNEADLYPDFAWYRGRNGHPFFSRPPTYGLDAFTRDFSRWRAAVRSAAPLPIDGPAFASLRWMEGLGRFLASEPRLGTVTFHRYPLRGCGADPSSPTYATIDNLLSDYSSSQLAQTLVPSVTVAHARGLPFRVDEMNSVACAGTRGVSDTFASALWALDTLFNLVSIGVDGVNIHTLPGAGYELFSFADLGGAWEAIVHPEYYGMLMFARADPPGSRLLPVTATPGQVKAWATLAPDGKTRVVLINKDTSAHTVTLNAAGHQDPATLERLQGPSLDATTGVNLGGQSFGQPTATGTLSAPADETVDGLLGPYSIQLPAASAALLTIG